MTTQATRRRIHNNSVQDNSAKASISYEDAFKPVRISTGHIDVLSSVDAREYAEEHDSEIKAIIDDMAIHERGKDDIGYATVENGEIVDWTIYAQYER